MRRKAYEEKIKARQRVASSALKVHATSPTSSGGWVPLGPVPLASDASGTGFQDYRQVSGRATAVAIDPADATGNTVYVGGAQGGVWKSANAAAAIGSDVTWTPLTDDQATLSVGSIAIQPGNINPNKSVILVATGEADSSADSYFGLGILRSADAGNSWSLIRTANNGSLSFSGLGGTRMAFSAASGQSSTVVAAMGDSSEGIVDGALTANTYRGLYTSTDAGQTWTYDALFSGASEATSATLVVYNASAGLFYAALRYHGFYSSPDGLTWTRLANQPGATGVLSSAACPQNYVTTCPIYRGELSVVPGRNEMYAWFISLDANDNPVDQGIWQSTNGGISWSQIIETGIANCGDLEGCGVNQGFYNLALLALPDGQATDLYAGAVNLYKCSISLINPACATIPFLNLTHAYGCSPLGAPAHVHPDQHAIANVISASLDLMYFANDGGIYRALDGFTGLNDGSCSGMNAFDDLNSNLGSMTQFVAFSQSTTDAGLLLGGTQDNGSPATANAASSLSWGNVLSGDGGFNAIDPTNGDWFASIPDTGGGTLNIQQCPSGVGCNDSLFSVAISSADLAGDDGGFYFPYILDPQSTSAMLVGTCRVWSGSRTGGAFTDYSLNFDTLGIGTCSGTEVNVIRSLAAGGISTASGSSVIYATTDGPGPNNPGFPVGGNVWVTTNATAVSGVSSTFVNVTMNGPGGTSINSHQFPVSGVAIDASDSSGQTAYVTVMGFTGGPGHVWQTTSAGGSWSDFSGTGAGAIPDSPANALAIDAAAHMIYVATDVGVFQSSTSTPQWTELGPVPQAGGGVTGFLPDVAVTALAIFNSGGQKLLRASTYGRGVWQYDLLAVPDFQFAISNTPLTVFAGVPAVFNGTVSELNGYSQAVALTCVAGGSNPPIPCTSAPSSLTPTQSGAPFTLTSTGTNAVTDYAFNVQGVGFDPNGTTHIAPVTLHVVDWNITTPMPNAVSVPRGSTSQAVTFQLSAEGSFNQSVSLSCSFSPSIPGGTCMFSPSGSFTLTSGAPVSGTVTVSVPAGTTTGPYGVTIAANTMGAPGALTSGFTANVTVNPTFSLTEPVAFPNVKAGSTGTSGSITISSQDGFAGTVSLSCVSAYGSNGCSFTPSSVSTFPANGTLTINGNNFSAGSYQVSVQGTSGALLESLSVPFSVGDYSANFPAALTALPGSVAAVNVTFTSESAYSGQINVTCDASAIAGALCSLDPASPLTINPGGMIGITANVSIPANATASTYSIAINSHDAGGEPLHNFSSALSVQDFVLSAVIPSTQTAGGGGTADYSLTVSPVGSAFGGAVGFSCGGAPAGSLCTFTPSTVVPASSTTPVAMSIALPPNALPGKYNLVVTGTTGSLTHSAAAALVVANSLQLTVTQGFPLSADAGSQQTAKVLLTPNYTGSVNAFCSVPSLPGPQCTITPGDPFAVSATPITLSVLLNIPNSAPPGTYNANLNVSDGSGTPTGSISLPFTVGSDFSLTPLTPSTQTITSGQSVTYNFSVQPVGGSFDGIVNFSCAGNPTISLCSFSPVSVTPGNSAAAVVLTVSTTGSAAAAFHDPLFFECWGALAFVWWLAFRAKFRLGFARSAVAGSLIFLIFTAISCGGGGTNGGPSLGGQGQGTPPGTYTITVTGASGALSHTGSPGILVIN